MAVAPLDDDDLDERGDQRLDKWLWFARVLKSRTRSTLGHFVWWAHK